VALTQFGKG